MCILSGKTLFLIPRSRSNIKFTFSKIALFRSISVSRTPLVLILLLVVPTDLFVYFTIKRVFHMSSVYLRILGQPFYPIFAHFSSFFPIFSKQDHFSKSLKHLKKNNIFKRYIIQNPHIIYLTYISKYFQLKSIFYIHSCTIKNF